MLQMIMHDIYFLYILMDSQVVEKKISISLTMSCCCKSDIRRLFQSPIVDVVAEKLRNKVLGRENKNTL